MIKHLTTDDAATANLPTLIQRLGEEALQYRAKQLDPDTRTGGTWFGAIGYAVFEGLSSGAAETVAARIADEGDDIPQPTDWMLNEMVHSAGLLDENGDIENPGSAFAYAVAATALYDHLGLPQPTGDNYPREGGADSPDDLDPEYEATWADQLWAAGMEIVG